MASFIITWLFGAVVIESFEKIPTPFVDLLALVSTHLKDHL
jgi:hypothetical protein